MMRVEYYAHMRDTVIIMVHAILSFVYYHAGLHKTPSFSLSLWYQSLSLVVSPIVFAYKRTISRLYDRLCLLVGR